MTLITRAWEGFKQIGYSEPLQKQMALQFVKGGILSSLYWSEKSVFFPSILFENLQKADFLKKSVSLRVTMVATLGYSIFNKFFYGLKFCREEEDSQGQAEMNSFGKNARYVQKVIVNINIGIAMHFCILELYREPALLAARLMPISTGMLMNYYKGGLADVLSDVSVVVSRYFL